MSTTHPTAQHGKHRRMDMELHVGRGTTRGAMTVFPLWSAQAGTSRYSGDPRHLDVSELDDGPSVSSLMVGNPGARPVLVLEGQLFEGGWQHRMACGSVLVGARQRVPVEVACVERGRWAGSVRQHSRGRRATPYVRDAAQRGGDVQGEVWDRVARHTRGTDNATGSLVQHIDAASTGSGAADFSLLPGQVGVLVGIGGQPYVAEVFDSPAMMRRQFEAIIQAAGMDARFAPVTPTPGRRARRFLAHGDEVWLEPSGDAGIGERVTGRTPHVDAASLRWHGRDLHLRLTNVRHPLLVGA